MGVCQNDTLSLIRWLGTLQHVARGPAVMTDLHVNSTYLLVRTNQVTNSDAMTA